ncbi:MAG TPA: FtsK/SpoIIIE domain-containing protein, partial [Acidimicrobiales bacterium]
MQIVFDDGAGRRDLDVRVNHPTATVADLAHALGHDGDAPAPLLIDGRPADADLGLREAGLHEGALVAPAGAARRAEDVGTGRPTRTRREPRWELVVVNGVDAGRRWPLAPGDHVLGRDAACDITLDHDAVSRRHAQVTLDADGRATLRDLDSHNGTWLAGEAVVAPVDLPEDTPFRVGALDLELRPVLDVDRPAAVDPHRATGPAGTIAFNRPPRAAVPPPPPDLTPPAPPRDTAGKAPVSVITIVPPLLFAGVMFAVLKQPQFLLFAGLSPVMAIGNAVDSRRRGRKAQREDRERYERAVERLRRDLAARAAEERQRRRTATPDPAEIARRVALPSTSLWERRPDHADFLLLRAGLGDVPWDPPVATHPSAGPVGSSPLSGSRPGSLPEEVAEVVDAAATLPRAAVPVDLSGGGVVGVVGERSAALALARSLVCQAAALHGPADLPVMVLADAAAGPDWDWVKWLPHTRGPSGVDRMLAAGRDLATRMVEARLDAARSSPERRARPGAAAGRAATTTAAQGPTLLLVVDDETLTAGRRAPTRNVLRGEAGPVAGIVVAASADRLPAVCTTVIEVRDADGQATLHQPQQGTRVDDFLTAGMAEDTARELARLLARYEDPELELVGAGLPTAIRLPALLDLDEPTPELIRARWKRSALDPHRLAVPIGVTEDGVFAVDLVGDGPHGLVGGTTGSGKSELLRTLVAGLAATHDPDHLTFVLIDFKGGAAFDVCGRLPHTVGLVTDLDEHLAERALRCLEAELKHRERVLRAAGAADLADLADHRRPGAEPLPRLVVIIDEFATLKAELPRFVDALVGIAQRGRSLGVHLLLATQRPQGAISDNIRANTDLRIALRVQDRSDSSDIVDVPDAAGIPRTVPGRAYVRLAPGEVVAVQTALATGVRSGEPPAPVDVAPFVYGPTPRRAAGGPAGAPVGTHAGGPGPDGEAPTDLAALVDAIGAAFAATGRPHPRRPWPDPLPAEVDLDEVVARHEALVEATGDDTEAGAAARRTVPLALADDPDAQTQYPVGWVPEDGNLVVYGIGGSGTTTTLATLALSLAGRHTADEAHLYVVDVGARELEALAALPHVGAVITAAERERQVRLVRMLRDELARRRRMGLAGVEEQPMVVTLIDGWSPLVAEYGDVAGGPVLEALHRVFADGPEVRMYTIVAADRPNAVPASLASLVRQRLVLRLSDPTAYTAFGIRTTAVPTMVPGRALVAGTGQVVQVARPARGLVAHAAAVAARTPRPTRPAPGVETLPTAFSLTELEVGAQLAARPWT